MKQEHLHKQKTAIDFILQEEIKKKQNISLIKDKKIQQILSINEIQENNKKKEILHKLEIKEINVKIFNNFRLKNNKNYRKKTLCLNRSSKNS